MRRASGAEASCESAESRAAADITVPADPSESACRSSSQSTRMALIAKPPPKESRLKSAVRRSTTPRDSPSALRGAAPAGAGVCAARGPAVSRR